MRNVEPPPPPHDDHAPDANAKPETAPQRKPWSAPTLKIMEMVFTENGFNSSPAWNENNLGPHIDDIPGNTYRTS